MNFDDRLRSHLTDQTADLTFTPEGIDGVRARSRRRKQRRAGAATLSIAAVAIVGALALFGSDTEQANLATEGDPAVTDTTAATADVAANIDATEAPSAPDVDVVLPDPGSALVLTSADNTGAPGGYNLFQTGRANGTYFVLSTAPGLTYEEAGGDFRPNTLYTFDGSRWTQDEFSDRFVSGFDSADDGVIYAVSTGSATSQELSVGRSTNGVSWDWTPIDLTSVFGADKSTWPIYSVKQATRDGQRFVVVATTGSVDVDIARRMAQDAGAEIGATDQVINASSTEISWFEHVEQPHCAAADNEISQRLWDAEPTGPEFDYERELTEVEQAELQEFWVAQENRGVEIRNETLALLAEIDGCTAYVSCATELADASAAASAQIEDLLASFGTAPFSPTGLSEGQTIELDRLYEEMGAEEQRWLEESGCAETLGWQVGGDVDPDSMKSARWSDLGVTIPESWAPAQYGFVLDGDVVTELGELFPGQVGFLVDVNDVNGMWTVTFDDTDYTLAQGVDGPIESTFTQWTSTNGQQWTASSTSWNYQPEAQTLSNGVGLSISWSETEAQLLRRNSDGSTNALVLGDLAPDLDTEGYSLARVATGEYGAVVTAVDWSQLESGGDYRSIVLYSPDGLGWGATSVPGVEVVDAIVGADDVIVFLNDPNREPGSAQPILIGK